MLCLMTLADVEAVSPETLTPWQDELLWRLYVDTYNHLTLRLRRRADRARTRRASADLLASRPADLSEDGDHALPRRAAAPLPAARSIGDAIYRHVRLARNIHPDEVHLWLERERLGLGAHGRHARQAVSVLEHLRRAVVVRHGHPARARDDQPERPGARRVPVHRPGAVSRAQRRTRASRCSRCWRRSSSGAPSVHARLRGREQSAAPPQARSGSRRSSTATIEASQALHDSRHHRRRRARAALPDQPRHLAERLRRRPRADRDRGPQGHRRVSHHQGGAKLVRGGARSS